MTGDDAVSCDTQDISRVGYIQDFGLVLVIGSETKIILAFSDNTTRFRWIKTLTADDLASSLSMDDILHPTICSTVTTSTETSPALGSVMHHTFTLTYDDLIFHMYVTVSRENTESYVVDLEERSELPYIDNIMNSWNTVNQISACTTTLETASTLCKRVVPRHRL